jgi:DNA-binding NtrC family response regulator
MERKARLLFVDDEERIINLLRMMFRAEYEVYTATSGQQALEIIATHRIDVLVSDQRMPGMTGIELLSEVRKRSPATMRILLTGYSDLTAIVGSVNDGEVFRFINKPWDHDEIKAIIGVAAEAACATAEVAVQAANPPAPASSDGARLELLLLDDSSGDRHAMEQIVNANYTIHGASSIPAALTILEQRDIGVIVAEARVGGRDTGELLRVLKQYYPSITTVILTSSADADLVIKLINGSQIFRFATKPIRAGVFQLAVSAAMREHLRLRANPTLASRHRVEPSREPENTSFVASVVQSLGKLRSRFSLFARLMG